MSNYSEKPFQFLRRKKGEDDSGNTVYSPEIIENWYKARAYVLDKLKNVAFGVDSDEYLRVVVIGDSPLMLSVVRQVALVSHFLNFDEDNEDDTKRRRTIITIVSQNPNIKNDLAKEEYLCNLLDFCKYDIFGNKENENSYVDLEIQVVEEWTAGGEIDCVEMKEEEVDSFCRASLYDTIDTRKAVLASRIYDLGTLVSNVPYEDIHDAKRYSQALDSFLYVQMEKPWCLLLGDDKKDNQTEVKEALSNIFCSDCFEIRAKEIEKMKEKDIAKCSDVHRKKIIRKENYWGKYIDALSRSEHARWVVEKLIMGYRPLGPEERMEDECIMGSKKLKQYRKKLKCNPKDPVHIDLCSYADLRRIDPDNLKYDSFLMLAIPEILKKCSKE